jgi:hypothetical protein
MHREAEGDVTSADEKLKSQIQSIFETRDPATPLWGPGQSRSRHKTPRGECGTRQQYPPTPLHLEAHVTGPISSIFFFPLRQFADSTMDWTVYVPWNSRVIPPPARQSAPTQNQAIRTRCGRPSRPVVPSELQSAVSPTAIGIP